VERGFAYKSEEAEALSTTVPKEVSKFLFTADKEPSKATNTARIANTYSLAAVNGQRDAGGLIGRLEQGSVRHSYSAGAISGTGEHILGLVGAFDSAGPVDASYWDTDRSGQTVSAAGAGRHTAELTFPYAANSYQDWDFQNVWTGDAEGRNLGYPMLRSASHVQYMLNLQAEPANAGTLRGNGWHYWGESVDIVAIPAPGYRFLTWKTDAGEVLSQEAAHAFVMPLRDIVLKGLFELKTSVPETGSPDTKGLSKPVQGLHSYRTAGRIRKGSNNQYVRTVRYGPHADRE
jgi:hypothetical protein